MHNILVQVIGSAITIGVVALIVVFGPRVMYEESWRFELLHYERERLIQATTTFYMNMMGDKVDEMYSITNLSSTELAYVVKEYSDVALPNASVLIQTENKFNPRWSESNARGALLENAVLTDNDMIIFPANESQYICTVVSLMAIVAGAMVCASMVAVYHKLVMAVLRYVTGLHSIESIESLQYARTTVAREALSLIVSLLFALFCLAQALVFGWLESSKSWKTGDIVFWGTLLFTGIGHSPVKPVYMMGIPQMSTWLSLCHFSMCLHTSASMGLVILTAVRCFNSRNSIENHSVSDEEIRSVMAVDHNRVVVSDVARPLYHN